MKEYFARLPFGKEQRLNLGFGGFCPVCNVPRGQEHEFGCHAEECPKCHDPVISCHCEALQPKDEIRIVMAIEKTFASLDDAFNAGAGVGNRNADTLTPLDKAAISYAMAHCPDHLKIGFDQKFERLFPDLKPTTTNENGVLGYSTVAIAEALGLPVEEVNEMARAMLGLDDNEPEPLAGCH